jgi:hypothetical protein
MVTGGICGFFGNFAGSTQTHGSSFRGFLAEFGDRIAENVTWVQVDRKVLFLGYLVEIQGFAFMEQARCFCLRAGNRMKDDISW